MFFAGRSNMPGAAGCSNILDSVTSCVSVTCWNCRGVHLAEPGIVSFINGGSDIIVLSEHWLWPHELYKLNEIHPDYVAHAVADKRLSEECEDVEVLPFYGTNHSRLLFSIPHLIECVPFNSDQLSV